MFVHTFFPGGPLRNYQYLIEDEGKSFWAVDPFDGAQLIHRMQELRGNLKGVIITHEHYDHWCGLEELLTFEKEVKVYVHPEARRKIPHKAYSIENGETLELQEKGAALRLFFTPGHTFAHLCIEIIEKGKVKSVFTGDTLFNAGVGNCKNGGDPQELYKTISECFSTYSNSVTVYPGHDYLESNLNFTLSFLPNLEHAKAALLRAKRRQSETSWFTTFGDERTFNLFLKGDEEEVQRAVSLHASKELVRPKDVFIHLRKTRDNW